MVPPIDPLLPAVRKALLQYRKRPLDRLSDLAGLSRETGDAVQSFGMGATEPLKVRGAKLASRAAARALDVARKYLGDGNGAPRTLYHGSAVPFDKFDWSRLGDNTGATDAQIGAHFAGNMSDADLYAQMAVRKAEERWYDFPNGTPKGHVGEYRVQASNPLVLSPFPRESSVPAATARRLLDDKIAAKKFAEANGFDAIVFPHGTNVDAGYTAIAFSPSQIEKLERMAALGIGGEATKALLAQARAAGGGQPQPPRLPPVTVTAPKRPTGNAAAGDSLEQIVMRRMARRGDR